MISEEYEDFGEYDAPEEWGAKLYKNSTYSALNLRPFSKEAVAVTEEIAKQSTDREKPLPNHIKILGFFLGDLLQARSIAPDYACYRAMSSGSYTGFDVGYHPFHAITKNLLKGGWIEREVGKRATKTTPGRVTRFWPTPKLFELLEAHGITPDNYKQHFKLREDLPVIQLKASRTFKSKKKIPGKVMKVDLTLPELQPVIKNIREINEFLDKQSYSGMVFQGLRRIYNQGNFKSFNWDKGGRLYGAYQSIKRGDRKKIKINGENVCEVDLKSSHLTLLHAILQCPMPPGDDPYCVPGVPRDIVKRFITMTLGNGKILEKWSDKANEDYAEDWAENPALGLTGNLNSDYPVDSIKEKIINQLPVLKELKNSGVTWADLQFFESEVLLASILELKNRGIPVLPIHDSLMCQISHQEIVKKILIQKFQEGMEIECKVSIKGI